MKRIVTKADIQKLDAAKAESNLRLIEMVVKSILLDLGNSEYAMQFFYDLGVYGHKEALAYLDNYVQAQTKRHPPSTYAEQFAKLSQIFVGLQARL